jgi:ribosomal protein S27AE
MDTPVQPEPIASTATQVQRPTCPNCGTSLALQVQPRYCPQCGQAVALQVPLLDTFRETVAKYWRTLVALIVHPGRLTLEFIAGRRVRFLPPLRIYFFASFLFFLVVRVLGVSTAAWQIEIAPAIDAHGRAITANSDPDAFRKIVAEMQACVDGTVRCSWWRVQMSRVQLKAVAQAGHTDAVGQRMLGMAPDAVFVLLPVFAALVGLAYRSRHMRYGTHFVFSLHTHSFLFLALLVLGQLPGTEALVAALALPVQAVLALRAVYQGRWWATLVRAAMIALLYLVALLITMEVLGIASILLT